MSIVNSQSLRKMVISVLVGFMLAKVALGSDATQVGSTVNTWTQAPVFATVKPFDLAIQGNGFFVLRLPNGEIAYSRYGEMMADLAGHLIHTPSRGQVMGIEDNNLVPINLKATFQNEHEEVIKSASVQLDGSMKITHDNGTVKTSSVRIALANFYNPTRLILEQAHVLRETTESGPSAIGVPLTSGRGSLFSSALEDLDRHMYLANIKSDHRDRVIVEMEKSTKAGEAWQKEKTLFYVYDLGLSRSELMEVEKSTDAVTLIIQGLVKRAEVAPVQISDVDFASGIKSALAKHEQEVLTVIGDSRLDQFKKFREQFNKGVWKKFGTEIRFTGF